MDVYKKNWGVWVGESMIGRFEPKKLNLENPDYPENQVRLGLISFG